MHKAVDKPLAFSPEDEGAWQQLVRGYRVAGLLVSAHRLGLPRALAEHGSMPATRLAGELLADAELIAEMCRALAAAGLLEATDDGWALSATGVRLAADPGASVELDAMAEDYQRWGQLDERARRLAAGEPRVPDQFDDYAHLRDRAGAARRYALRLAARHRDQAVGLIDRVRPTRPLQVLDVGGGEGTVARELCRQWPEASCTIVEQPRMAEVARQACGHQPRIDVVEGDFLADDFLPATGAPVQAFDVVVLSHVLQGLRKDQQHHLIQQVVKVLAPGGAMLSCESVLQFDARGPLDVLLWTLGERAAHGCGHVLTTNEQDLLLRLAGLAAVGEWWVSDSTRAVLAVTPTAAVTPALALHDANTDRAESFGP